MKRLIAPWSDQPEGSAEICIFEIFGRDVTPGGAIVGLGVHPFGDPGIRDEFLKIPVTADVRQFHTYSVEWTPGRVRFHIDDTLVATVDQAPDYPIQLMLNIYEFEAEPGEAEPGEAEPGGEGARLPEGVRRRLGEGVPSAASARKLDVKKA